MQGFPVERVLELRDGRRLGYGVVGGRSATTVFHLHGAIGAPLSPSPDLQRLVSELGVRFVTVYRPGFGSSSDQPGRSMLDHAEDVCQLADTLDVGRMAIVGVSAGGPYALACAHALGARVTGVAAISSMAPSGAPCRSAAVPRRVRWPLRLLSHSPRTATAIGNFGVRAIRRHPKLLIRSMASGAPAADRALLTEQTTGDEAISSFLAATARGVRGMVDDYRVAIGDWGFDPVAIETDVHLWHGAKDNIVPIDHALQIATTSDRFRITLDPDEGHFFFRRRLSEILRDLIIQRAPAAAEPITIRRSSDSRLPGRQAA